jgi:hypothetical protein
MTSLVTGRPAQRAVRVAGVGYLLSTIIPLLSTFLIYDKLLVPEDAAATAQNVLSHPLLFRVGLASDLLGSANVLVLALALFALLEPVDRRLALFGLLLRLGDVVLMSVSVLAGLTALLLLSGAGASTAFTVPQVQALAATLLHLRSETSVLFFFVGSGAAIPCYLFWKSGYLPRAWAAFGIGSFLILLAYAFVDLLFPAFAGLAAVQGVCFTPSCVFELGTGAWLLLKGLRTPAVA